jgi:hypothetical protein
MLQTATTAMSRITRDIRGAGIFYPTGPSASATPPANYAAVCVTAQSTMLVSATNGPPGSITFYTILDDPTVRTEIATTPTTGQTNTNATIGVLSSSGYQVNDVAFITDGVQCTKFTVTGVVGGATPGLQHVPANDLNTFSGTYTYPVASSLGGPSMVYRVKSITQTTYSIDTTNPKNPSLTKTVGSGPAVRLVPGVQSLSFSYGVWNGTTIQTGVSPATITTVAQAANVRGVTVTMIVQADTPDPHVGFRTQILASTVELRNLGS